MKTIHEPFYTDFYTETPIPDGDGGKGFIIAMTLGFIFFVALCIILL
jgi:hypothetical protein